MKNLKQFLVGLIIVAILPGIYISCGGGGGSSSGTPTAEPAVLNKETVDKTVQLLDETVPFCTMAATPGSMADSLYALVEMAQDITDQAKLIKISKDKAGADADAMAEEETVLDGDCGGQIIMSMDQNEADGTISGGIVINNYCASLDGETQLNANGEATLSGSTQTLSNGDQKIMLQLDTDTPITIQQGGDSISISISGAVISITQGTDLTSMTLALSEVVFTDGSDSYTLGNVSIAVSMTDGELEDQIIIGVNSMVLEEDTSDGSVTHQLSNVSINMTSGATGSTMSVSGTYSSSDEGSVTISTPEIITVSSEGEIISGTIFINGAQGTRVEIEASGGNFFVIQADTNGDGSYDYQTGTMDCSAFDSESLL